MVHSANRYPHELSGGQRQRVNISRALAFEPKLLVLDEAVSALDKSVEAQVLNLLSEIKAAFDLTYVFISHDLSVVRYMSDRVMVMYLGKVVEIGPVGSIYTAPRHPYTQRLLECDQARQAQRVRRLPTIAGEIPDLRCRPAGCIFAPRCFRRFDACAKAPPEQDIGGGHVARCFLAEQPETAKERT